MCAIYKNKGDIKEIKNYRPIFLTIVAKRIFEKIVDAKLETYKEKLHSNVSSAIKVFPNLLRSSILSWNGLEDAKIKLELIRALE